MKDQEFEILQEVYNSFNKAKYVCDPIDFIGRQKELLYRIGEYLQYKLQEEYERREAETEVNEIL